MSKLLLPVNATSVPREGKTPIWINPGTNEFSLTELDNFIKCFFATFSDVGGKGTGGNFVVFFGDPVNKHIYYCSIGKNSAEWKLSERKEGDVFLGLNVTEFFESLSAE